MALFAIALLVAVTRFNLFDIDRILSATASLSLLLGGGLVVLLLGAPHLTALVGEVLGLQANLAQPLVVLVVSGVAVAGARAAYPLVDRLLFVERAALQRNLSALLRQVKAADSPQAATELVGRELARLLRPQVLAIYDHDDPAWPLYFAHGHAVVPALPQQTRLPDALARAGDVLSFEAGGSRRPESLTPLDRSLVQALDARVVLGIRDVDGLRELLFIGPKGSGDLFVHSDLALLASIAHALSATHERLQRKASEKVSESEPSPTEHALRSYVPGPLVSHIVRGEPIEQGEKDVTLLFIDIRGYSSYAEHRAPSEVFSMVSTYTRGVSEIVLRHHGTVVEFNGDGMMVVFGAPASVDHKEEHAVHAARELITRARQIVPLDRDDGLTPIGIGIATGRAFVGSVQGSDRAIWTALGASTNRAARLQGVTRELHADIVIDEATYRALGTVRRQFELHRGMQLRGHAERNNLYSMALEPLPAAPAIHAATA
jgi:class 3 adenylate cyclase